MKEPTKAKIVPVFASDASGYYFVRTSCFLYSKETGKVLDSSYDDKRIIIAKGDHIIHCPL